MEKNILVLTNKMVELSETFIYNQIEFSNAQNLTIVCSQRINQNLFPVSKKIEFIDFKARTLIDRILSKIIRLVRGKWSYSLPYSAEVKLSRIIKENRIELIHAHYGTNGLRVYHIANKFKLPIIVSFHGYDASQLLKKSLYVENLKKLFNYNTTVVLCAQKQLSYFKENGVDVPGKRKVVNYGIDLSKVIPKLTYGTKKSVTILHVGRLTGKKGVNDLMFAVDNLNCNKAIKLKIAGDGEEYSKLLEQKKILKNPDRIEFLGAVSHSKVFSILPTADIFVLNSRTSEKGDSEGFPNVLIEAMASGLPVISTRHAGIEELIDDKINGLLTGEKNILELTEALHTLLHDTALRKKLGLNARKKVEAKYTLQKMNKEISNLYLQ